jgi:hypothetical protein
VGVGCVGVAWGIGSIGGWEGRGVAGGGEGSGEGSWWLGKGGEDAITRKSYHKWSYSSFINLTSGLLWWVIRLQSHTIYQQPCSSTITMLAFQLLVGFKSYSGELEYYF